MAHPFGGHPKLSMYLDWLRSQGFEYQSGYSAGESGKDIDTEAEINLTIRVTNREGKPLLHIFDVSLDEYLTPSQVGNFDRRLGVNSPFAKVPSAD